MYMIALRFQYTDESEYVKDQQTWLCLKYHQQNQSYLAFSSWIFTPFIFQPFMCILEWIDWLVN